MNARAIPRAAVDGYLKLLRWPLDLAVERSGNEAIELTLDRTEATVRSVAGAVLRDDVLINDAATRRAAADERERALRLRHQAQETRAEADQKLSQRQQEAEQERKRAEKQAEERRKAAQKRRDEKKQQAAKAESARKQAARKQAAKAQEASESRARKAKLDQLETKSEALEEKEQAIVAKDEAQRLGDAASRVKAGRKSA